MEKEELIEFLKENLQIKAELVSNETGYCRPDSHSVKVTIILGDEIISTSETDSIYQ